MGAVRLGEGAPDSKTAIFCCVGLIPCVRYLLACPPPQDEKSVCERPSGILGPDRGGMQLCVKIAGSSRVFGFEHLKRRGLVCRIPHLLCDVLFVDGVRAGSIFVEASVALLLLLREIGEFIPLIGLFFLLGRLLFLEIGYSIGLVLTRGLCGDCMLL